MSHTSDWHWLSFAGDEPTSPTSQHEGAAEGEGQCEAYPVVGLDRLSDYVGEVRPINPKE